ncbi:MAG: gluconate 2-dehydrogenase subunit 3 family protein [Gemmatimonadota bacterium]
MNRRQVLSYLGAAALAPLLAPLSAEKKLEIGQALHARLSGAARPRAGLALSANQREMVAEIAEIIIPETDTPGARSVHVDEFIDMLLAEWYSPEERDQFIAGLGEIDARAMQRSGHPFLELAPGDRIALLETLDGTAGQPGTAEGTFARLKNLTVYGWCTSKEVSTNVLKVEIIPGRYDGCVVIAKP